MATVPGAIKDPTCLALRPVTEEGERALEEMMPPEDIPRGGSIAAAVEEEGLLAEEQRQLLAELFENLEVIHESAAQTCSILARLLRTLGSN